MSINAEKDVSPAVVALMLGVSIGIPLGIVGGMYLGETGWGLISGPFIGLAIGAVLAKLAPTGEAAA